MTWEYVAGLFDGEGTVVTYRQSTGTHLRFCIAIKKRPEVLMTIQDFLGYGHLFTSKQGTVRLVISGRAHQRHFIRGIYPHVYIKRRVLGLAWLFTDKILQPGEHNPDHEAREILARRIREANARYT